MSQQIEFRRGEFLAFRAITQVHLGALSDDLHEGEVIEFDGATMKRGPDVHSVPSLRAAIKAGWLVPEDQEGGVYRPMPAGVEVRPAETRGNQRGPARKMGMVEDEERDLGHLTDVRPGNAPPTHRASNAKQEVHRGQGTGAKVWDQNDQRTRKRFKVETEAGQEGRVIGKLKSPAKADAVNIPKGEDRRVKMALSKDTGRGVAIERYGPEGEPEIVTTGDVESARAGDELEELLPDAASVGRPKAGVAGEGEDQESPEERAKRLAEAKARADAERAKRLGQVSKSAGEKEAKQARPHRHDNWEDSAKAQVSASGDPISGTEAKVSSSQADPNYEVTITPGGTSVGGAEDGKVVGKIGQTAEDRRRGVAVEPEPEELEVAFEDEGEPVGEEKPDREIEAAFAPDPLPEPTCSTEEPEEEEPEEEVPPEAIVQAKIEMIQQFVPGFEWDLKVQWRRRVKKALEYKNNMPVLNAILSIETATVRKHIMKQMYGDG